LIEVWTDLDWLSIKPRISIPSMNLDNGVKTSGGAMWPSAISLYLIFSMHWTAEQPVGLGCRPPNLQRCYHPQGHQGPCSQVAYDVQEDQETSANRRSWHCQCWYDPRKRGRIEWKTERLVEVEMDCGGGSLPMGWGRGPASREACDTI